MDYQEEYIKLHPDLHEDDVEDKVSAINKVILQADLKVGSVLDVACGSGKILLKLVNDHGIKKSRGIDISEKILSIAKDNDSENKVSWSVMDVFDFEESGFDLVLAVDVMEHVENDSKFLRKVSELGKYVVVKVPLENTVMNKLVKLLTFGKVNQTKKTENKYGHIHHYSRSEVMRKISNINLEVIVENRMYLPKRSSFGWEFIRVLMSPVWYLSQKLYLKLNGGFLVLLLKKKGRK